MERSSAFLLKMEDLVKQVVAYNHIPCYRVDSSWETQQTPAGELVAIPVIRVVGFFEDTIAKITTVLNSEFELYQIAYAGNEGFGNTTSAYQASLRTNRLELPEYNILEPHKFDIYVSSILQDVYSAMHRNLTGAGTLPEDLKRDFYRIGAFLEMADIEFIKIRNKVSHGEYDLTPGSMVQIPVVERTGYTPIPTQTTPAAELKPIATPAHEEVASQPETPATVAAVPKTSHVPHIESMEMNVDSFDALAVSINNVDTSNGVSSNDYFDLLTSSHHQKQSDSYDLLSSVQNIPATQPVPPVVTEAPKPAPVAEAPKMQPVPPVAIPEIPMADVVTTHNEDEVVHHEPILSEATQPNTSETPKSGFSSPGEGVALNIDKIDTFNMNVSGMIERTTEIIREVPSGTNGVAAGVATAAGGIAIDSAVSAANNTNSTMPLPVSSTEKGQDDGPLNMDETIQMSDAMLREYVRTSNLVKDIDRMIAERAGARINDDVDIEGDVERLRFLKVNTMRQLTERLMDNKDDIVSFAEKWIGKDNGGSFDSGICLFYLEYLLVGKRNDPAFSVEYVLKFISDNDYSARYIIPTYNAVRHAAGEPASSNFAHLTLK